MVCDVLNFAGWIRDASTAKGNTCGGVHGADKLAHCWAACMAASCYDVFGSCFIRKNGILVMKQILMTLKLKIEVYLVL